MNQYPTSTMGWFAGFVTAHPYLGYILTIVLLVIGVLWWAADAIPRLEVIKSKMLLPLAKKWKQRQLVKAAIESDIQGNVNRAVGKLAKELPAGWIPQVKIEWVGAETKEDFLSNDEPVIRVRPLENQDSNFVNAVHSFFKRHFFPKTQRIIPDAHREASILYVCERVVSQRGDAAVRKAFEDDILEPAVQKEDKVLDHLDHYKQIDKRGFFTAAFLRETHAIATEVRFEPARRRMNEEIRNILKHMDEFIAHYESEEGRIPDTGWSRFGPVTSYGFLLVANPMKVAAGARAYVNRAGERLKSGVHRLYVLGTAREKAFMMDVVDSIKKEVPGYELAELFEVNRDYRGEEGGVGALFVSRNK